MKSSFRKLALSAAISSVTATLPMNASATNGILPVGNGIVSQGAGGTGVANASDGMSAADNPALAAEVGAGWSIQLTAFNPNRSANVGNGYVDSDSDWFPIPGGSWFTDVNDKTVAGLTVTALGGMNTNYPPELFGARTGFDLSGVIIAPTIATQVSDAVSLGGAILFGYERMETEGPGQPPLPKDETDDATGWGFELGIAVKAGPTTTLGLDYQSKIDMGDMEEHAKYIFAQTDDPSVPLPAIITLGITQQIGQNWKISADVSDVPWSDAGVIGDVFLWEDQTVFKIGAEVQLNDTTALRFGYSHADNSPIPDSAVQNNILAPATPEDHATIGFSKAMGNGILHGYYAYSIENEQTQNPVPPGFPTARIKMDQNAFGLGWEVKL
jgi:long-chain fatty acid transport protein